MNQVTHCCVDGRRSKVKGWDESWDTFNEDRLSSRTLDVEERTVRVATGLQYIEDEAGK